MGKILLQAEGFCSWFCKTFFFFCRSWKEEKSWGRRTTQAARTTIKPGNLRTVKKGVLEAVEVLSLTGCRSTPGSSVLLVQIQVHCKKIPAATSFKRACKGLKIWVMIQIRQVTLSQKSIQSMQKISPVLQMTGNTVFLAVTRNCAR